MEIIRKNKIKNGNKNIERAVTLKDVAERLGVTAVTVSKALRNHPDISDSTKALIKSTAGAMGYSPNLIARNLSARRTNTIGVVVPKVAHYFFGSIIEHIYNIAFARGYEIILTVSQESAELEKKQIQTLLSMKVDGIIISISRETSDYEIFDLVRRRGIPIVFIDRIPEMQNVNTVTVDDYTGAYKAVKHAISLGYRKIAHFAGRSNVNIGHQRSRGFYDAMRDDQIEVNPDWVIEGGFDEDSGYEAFMKLYKTGSLPDFIFAVTYPVALGIYRAASELGINIPYDVDLICFGNAETQTFLKPPLSCVDQPTDLLAQKAMDLLLTNITNNESSEPEHEVIETNLILRKTALVKKQTDNNVA